MIARADRERVGFGRRQAGLEASIHEQTPYLLEGDHADEILDVDAAIAQRAPGFVRLGDFGGKGDDSLKTRLHLCRCAGGGAALLWGRGLDRRGLDLAHGTRFLSLMLEVVGCLLGRAIWSQECPPG